VVDKADAMLTLSSAL